MSLKIGVKILLHGENFVLKVVIAITVDEQKPRTENFCYVSLAKNMVKIFIIPS